MRRRDFFPSICAASLAMPRAGAAATESKARFRPAICAYSFRDQMKDKSMTYADIIPMAADGGPDGGAGVQGVGRAAGQWGMLGHSGNSSRDPGTREMVVVVAQAK